MQQIQQLTTLPKEERAQILAIQWELSAFQRALQEKLPEQGQSSPEPRTAIVAALLKLAPLVFARPGDLRSARWADIDLEAAEWRFTADKTGKVQIVPLAVQAVDILRRLYLLTGRGEFVFPSARRSEGPMSETELHMAQRKLALDRVRVYDFRRMARTVLADKAFGIPLDCIKLQLGHPAVLDRLECSYHPQKCDPAYRLDERRTMMQVWADWLDTLRDGGDAVAMAA